MSPHEHAWYLYRQEGPVRLLRCWGCHGERREARAFFGRVVRGPATWSNPYQ